MKRNPIDPDLLRGRLSKAQGKRCWRCLEELANEPQFRSLLDREFAADSNVWADDLLAAQVPHPDGRLAGPGRPVRLSAAGGPHHALRSSAG